MYVCCSVLYIRVCVSSLLQKHGFCVCTLAYVRIKISMYERRLAMCQSKYKVSVYIYAKQKHLGCKKVRGQSEAACKQAGATKSFDIS